jgi:hypothetical protein
MLYEAAYYSEFIRINVHSRNHRANFLWDRFWKTKRGNLVPHDLRRHSAEFASPSDAPIEIVTYIILRYANL